MRGIENHFSLKKHVEKQNGVRFFIASNSEESKQYLLQRFPTAVSLQGGEYGRGLPEGIRFALLDWLLLSETAVLINTYGSSFAAEVEFPFCFFFPFPFFLFLSLSVCLSLCLSVCQSFFLFFFLSFFLANMHAKNRVCNE